MTTASDPSSGALEERRRPMGDDVQDPSGAPGGAGEPAPPELGLEDPQAEHAGAGPSGAEAASSKGTEPVLASDPVAKRVYYSIGEVGLLTGLKPHVLRYWETQFDAVSPGKNRGGSRVYRVDDIRAILLVKRLLYEERFTIEGAKQKLDEMRREGALGNESALRAEPAMLALIKEGILAARSALTLPEAPAAPSPD